MTIRDEDSYIEFKEQREHREINPETPGFGRHYRTGITILNLTGSPITVVDRKGFRYTLPDQRHEQVLWKDSPCKTVTNVYDARYHQVKDRNYNKEVGIYVYISYYFSADVWDSLERHFNHTQEKDFKPFQHQWIKSIGKENIQLSKKAKDNGKSMWSISENREEYTFSEEIFIPLSAFDRVQNVYSVRSDYLFSLNDIYRAPHHPYSEEGIELKRVKEAENKLKENPNLETKIRYVQKLTHSHQHLFQRNARGCRLIQPEQPSEHFPEPGIYIEEVYFDPEANENRINHIRLDYSNNEEIRKHGLYKTYGEAMMPPKLETDLEHLKFKKEQDAKKELGNILNHSSGIIIAISALLTKFIVFLTVNASKSAAKNAFI